MANNNLPNGILPQQAGNLKQSILPNQGGPISHHFNGMNSSQSSRNHSPAVPLEQIPASQLPPRQISVSSPHGSTYPSSVNPVTQKISELTLNNPPSPAATQKFNTSTPSHPVSQQTASVPDSFSPLNVFSPITPLNNQSRVAEQKIVANSNNEVSNPNGPVTSQNLGHNVNTSNFKLDYVNNQQSNVNTSAHMALHQVPLGQYTTGLVPQQNTASQSSPHASQNQSAPNYTQIPNLMNQNANFPSSQGSFYQNQNLSNQRPPMSNTQLPRQNMMPNGPLKPPMLQPKQTQPPNSMQQIPSANQIPTNQYILNQGGYSSAPNLNQASVPTVTSTAHPANVPASTYQVPATSHVTPNRIPPTNQQRGYLFNNRYPSSVNLQQQPHVLQQQHQLKAQSIPPQPAQYPQQSPYVAQQQSVPAHQHYPNYQPTVASMGFNKLWGNENHDLLQSVNILPPTAIEAPRVSLGQEGLDDANCSPDIFRCTLTKIPETNSLLQKSRLPLGILIHPFKDLSYLPVIQCNVIVRCRACRTYINPFVYFTDNKRWKCNLCYRLNDLPEEFQYDPVSKTYGDPSRRPEVQSSTIEYIAPAEYMLRPPQPAVYLFLLDISRAAIESGYLKTVCRVLLEEIKSLPGDARTQIGFLAYNSHLHYFSLAEGLSQPHEMTVLEIDEVFLPCPDNLLVNLKDRMEMIIDLLEQLPLLYINTFDNNSALGAALQAAHRLMSPTGGRVTVFQATLPNIGPGALTPREVPSQRSTVDVALINPANDFYKRLSLECSAQQIAVDLFTVNSQFIDIATISGISRFSGGCMYHFPLFKADRMPSNDSLERCFKRYLSRKIGFEAVMRIRCTRGLSIHTFHGNFFVRSTDLLSLPNINPDAAYGMQVAIDENLSELQTVCFQAALLYTSSKGERRIRVHTLCLPITSVLHDVINSADQQCIVGLLAKMAVDRSMQSSLSDAREAFINVAIDILSSYKMSLNLGQSPPGLCAPECLKLLPLYISALLKSTAFRTSTTRIDDRIKAMLDMKTKPLYQLMQEIYPDLYPIHNLEEQQVVLNSEDEQVPSPPHLHLTARCLENRGAFLLDMGENMIIYVGSSVSQTFLKEALGVTDFKTMKDCMYELPYLENPHNKRLHQFINYLNYEKPFIATLHIIRDVSSNRLMFLERLIEDRQENALSYHEFLQHLKSQVK